MFCFLVFSFSLSNELNILGPLLVEKDGRYVIAGVTSWGYDCGAQGYPGVYARVTAQLGWIHETIGGEETLCEVDESDARCIQN